MNYVNLHSHTFFSLLDGHDSPLTLFERAKELGMPGMAITDHGTLSSHFDALEAEKSTGVKALLGVEAYFTPDRFNRTPRKDRKPDDQIYNHLCIIAKNEQGLRNLNVLSEKAWIEGFYVKPRMDFDLLDEYGDGLVVTSGCMNGSIARAIDNGYEAVALEHARWFSERFGEDFYMEVQPHNPKTLNHALLDFADGQGIKSVVTLDCHYANPADKVAEEIMLILGSHPDLRRESNFASSRKIKDHLERLDYLYGERQMSFKDLDIYLMGQPDIQERMVAQGIDREDIYANAMEVFDKHEGYTEREAVNLLPVDHANPDAQLKKAANSGLAKRGLSSPEYQARLDEELEIIKDKDFSSYFIIVSNMIRWAKRQGILVGPGRGSSAGSLVCYSLGITEVDPIKYNLLFSRFIDPGRADYPDIDTDFQKDRRGEIKEYLERQYTYVGSIATWLTFKDKGVVRDVARVFNVPLGEVNKALKNVDTWESFIRSPDTIKFREDYPEVVQYADHLRGRIRGTGMHPAGVVTAREDLSLHAPIETRSDATTKVRLPVVAVDMDRADKIGLIKVDALGLKALTIIQDTIKSIKERHGKDIDMTKVSLDDSRVYEMLSDGNTQGVFQAEAAPFTSLLLKMGVSNFNELAVSNALVRPGAMNTIGAEYIARKHGKRGVSFLTDSMKDYTDDTMGTVIFQEQVMQACMDLGNMSMAEANKVRKIIGKKKDVSEFDEFRKKFVNNAKSRIGEKGAEKLWHDFEEHASYSFAKSHAVAYTMVTYWTAWLKVNYPLEFMVAVLKNEEKKDSITDHLIEARRLGLTVRLPHINKSEESFSIDNGDIRIGLTNVKYISSKVAANIMKRRPFDDYASFLAAAQAKYSGINKRAIDSLNKIGAAQFSDNRLSGNEKENYYVILGIPEFSTSLPLSVTSQATDIADFDEGDTAIVVGMVKKVKIGAGWSRVSIVDKTGSTSAFDSDKTDIEEGKMYVMLLAGNRIATHISVSEITDKPNHPLIRYLEAPLFSIDDDQYYVISFAGRKTKNGSRMANVVLSDMDKRLYNALAFDKEFAQVYAKAKPSAIIRPKLGSTKDGTMVIRGFERK